MVIQKCFIMRKNSPATKVLFELNLEHNLVNNLRVLVTAPHTKEKMARIIPKELFNSIQNGDNEVIEHISARYVSPLSSTDTELDIQKILSEKVQKYTKDDYEKYGYPTIVIHIKGIPCDICNSAEPTEKIRCELDIYKPLKIALQDLLENSRSTDVGRILSGSDRDFTESLSFDGLAVSFEMSSQPRAAGRNSVTIRLDPDKSLFQQWDKIAGGSREKDVIPEISISFSDKNSGKTEAGRTKKKKQKRNGKVVAGVCIVMVLASAAVLFFWTRRDRSIEQIEKALTEHNYSGAVQIYNEEIRGDDRKEKEAEKSFQEEIDALQSEYEKKQITYADAVDNLTELSGVKNDDLIQYSYICRAIIALYEGEYRELVSAYNEIEVVNADPVNKVNALIDEKIGGILESYLNAEITFDEAVEELTYFAALKNDTLSEKAVSKLDSVNENNTARNNLEKGRELAEAGKYYDAVTYFQLVSNETDMYEDARQAIEECCDQFLSTFDIPDSIDSCLEKIIETNAFDELVENEKISTRLQQLKTKCTALVKAETEELRNKGSYNTAMELVEKVLEIFESDSLLSLRDQISDEAVATKVSYDAVPAEFIYNKGSISSDEDLDKYSFTADEEGVYCLTFSEMQYEFSVYAIILDKNNERVQIGDGYAENNSTVITRTIPKGNYTIQVSHRTNSGNYEFTIGKQKKTVPIDDYNVVKDAIEFAGQENHYRFTAEESGIYRFDFSEMLYETNLEVTIYDHLKRPTAYTVSNDSGFTQMMESDETYDICIKQHSGLTHYDMSIGKQQRMRILKAGETINGSFRFIDQQDVYIFKPDVTKKYTLSGNPENWSKWKVWIVDENNNPVEPETTDETAFSYGMKAGKTYYIYCNFKDEVTDYSFVVH